MSAPDTSWVADMWDALFGRLLTFYRVEHDGSWFICRAHEVHDWLRDEGDSTVYTVTPVRMTQRQFNALPEFKGF